MTRERAFEIAEENAVFESAGTDATHQFADNVVDAIMEAVAEAKHDV